MHYMAICPDRQDMQRKFPSVFLKMAFSPESTYIFSEEP